MMIVIAPGWARRQIEVVRRSGLSGSGAVTAIDLFCGAGGLAYGLRNAGVNVVAGVDVDPDCEYPFTFNNSARFLLRDIKSVTADILDPFWDESGIKLLAGCAPCQPFSTLRQSSAHQKDSKWNLLNHFGRLVEESSPEIVTMENVPGLMRTEIFTDFVEKLKRLKYVVDYRVLFLPSYGLPQHRKRLVLIASKVGEILVPEGNLHPGQFRTVEDEIRDFPPLVHGEQSAGDPMHRTQSLSDKNLRRIAASSPGGTWRDWPAELQLDCHRRDTGKYYASVYGRMEWSAPSPTITTQFFNYGTGRFGHPEQDRAISLREGAALQGFPPHYQFVEQGQPYVIHKIGRLIGNAVPPLLGEIIGAAIQRSVIEPKLLDFLQRGVADVGRVEVAAHDVGLSLAAM